MSNDLSTSSHPTHSSFLGDMTPSRTGTLLYARRTHQFTNNPTSAALIQSALASNFPFAKQSKMLKHLYDEPDDAIEGLLG